MKPRLAVVADAFHRVAAIIDAVTDGAVLPIEVAYDDAMTDVAGLFIYAPHDSTLEGDAGAIVEDALACGVPILGSASGMHALNRAFGAAPSPILGHDDGADDSPARVATFLAPGAKVSSTIGGSGWLTLPRAGKRAISQAALSPRLMPSALASDRTVVAYELPGHSWAIGVQWDVLRLATGDDAMPRGFDAVWLAFVERVRGV